MLEDDNLINTQARPRGPAQRHLQRGCRWLSLVLKGAPTAKGCGGTADAQGAPPSHQSLTWVDTAFRRRLQTSFPPRLLTDRSDYSSRWTMAGWRRCDIGLRAQSCPQETGHRDLRRKYSPQKAINRQRDYKLTSLGSWTGPDNY